jgi:hypothetical protein
MIKIKCTIVCILCFGILRSTVAQGVEINEALKQRCYVWSFSTRENEQNQLTKNLTYEFEEALVKEKLFVVLNRTKFANVLEQWQGEKGIQGISDLPDTTINKFKIISANLVFFGELYEEAENNVSRITVTLQNFDSEIVLRESINADMSKMNSVLYREIILEKLLKSISRAVNGERIVDKIISFKEIRLKNFRRGLDIETLFPPGVSDIGFGTRVSFISEKRWGINVGIANNNDRYFSWVGYNHNFFSQKVEPWGLVGGIHLGIANDWFFGFADCKLRYKIYTASLGIGINDEGSLQPWFGIGLHFPIYKNNVSL